MTEAESSLLAVMRKPEPPQDTAIMRLWKSRFNTFDIARLTKLRECDVANRLARLLDAGAV